MFITLRTNRWTVPAVSGALIVLALLLDRRSAPGTVAMVAAAVVAGTRCPPSSPRRDPPDAGSDVAAEVPP